MQLPKWERERCSEIHSKRCYLPVLHFLQKCLLPTIMLPAPAIYIYLLDCTAGTTHSCNILLEQAASLSQHVTFTWEQAFSGYLHVIFAHKLLLLCTQLPCIHIYMQIRIQNNFWSLVECCSLQMKRHANFTSPLCLRTASWIF